MKLFQKHTIPEEGSQAQAAPAGRIPLTHRTAVKAAAFLLAILTPVLAVISVLAGLFMISKGLYTIPETVSLENAYRHQSRSDCAIVLNLMAENQEQAAVHHLENRNVAALEIVDMESGSIVWSWQSDTLSPDGPTYEDLSTWHAQFEGSDFMLYEPSLTTRIALPAQPVFQDEYLLAHTLVSLAYDLLYSIWVIAVLAAIAAVACFIFLMCASGHHAGLPGVQPGWGTRIPFDLLTAALGFSVTFLIALVSDLLFVWSDLPALAACVSAALVVLVAFLGWCMSFALRVKLGGWWKNTLIYYILRLCWRLLRRFARGITAFFRGCGALLTGIPLVWKAALGYLVFSFAGLLLYAFAFSGWNYDGVVFFWFLSKLLWFPPVILLALMLRRLQKGGEALAAGDLSHHIDTKKMLPTLRRHGENLNSLGAGMTIAVEQRLRSERMKTELITNVSHDIKTPLTSIINYADLIGKEPTDNEKIREYSVVLLRQSERLKRLIDDLVEASKASTGNLEILLAPCDAGVMLTQAAGEYEQRMAQAHLELVTTRPDRPVTILADGRRLWRVVDNLMNNICKYAQPGTRVYLTLEEVSRQAVITFKNTSREPLNIPAEELMERFIRGDSSRSTEGNGLGLSIAKSLTDLQKGSFELAVDGDLFKVTLRFPTL